MLKYFKTEGQQLLPIAAIEDGCWISAIAPTESEIVHLTGQLGVEPGFVRAALDEEEASRIEREDDQLLVIVDLPFVQKEEEKTIVYSTMPMGIIVTSKNIITVCLGENPVVSEFERGLVKNVQTQLKTQFLLYLLLRIATRFLICLKQIDKISSYSEKQLHKSMRNKELIQLLGLEKSLVYFSTSLKSNEVTLEKIHRGRMIRLYEEDEELLEDVLIEIRQANEMCGIYTNILSNTMDAFSSIINNNLNIVMKTLTSLTVLMAIPTVVSGLWGMNVNNLPSSNFWFPVLLALLLTGCTALALFLRGMFK
ncbi:MAG: magnesium transporter CorA family protein [Provencibacterium sp.]|jgi:magnesium transporter|nr:magnesium transporter CorA family protein [Provencibacterium sp.]